MSSTAPAKAVVIHGHFYQPPREDPWLDRVPLQSGAAPYHDWNERVEAECYQPVVKARILDGEGGTRRVMNCLEFMSFNFGPTLLSWLEAHRRDTYEAVLSADAVAMARWGHGAALAMPFHHSILPLATRRDKRTEVRWGILDFKRRFGRLPEGVWLPETAADEETLEVLAGEGVRFTILAPSQVKDAPARGRPGIVRTPGGDTLTVFPYHGDLSHAVAFGGALGDAAAWADSLESEAEKSDLCLVATDGETYGHHKTFGEMALAATLERLHAAEDVTLTNLAAYLAEHPATEEVELVSPSSWSCAHGVGRWQDDCGCRLDPGTDSSQAWRRPLRDAVSRLAEDIHGVFDSTGPGVFPDAWAVRDAYGEVAGSEDPAEKRAWAGEQCIEGADLDGAVRLLEMERNALRIFTSCAWFFDDLTGVEQVQVLRYAARALELVAGVGGPAEEIQERFLAALAKARSNESEPRDGREFYLEDVLPTIPATAWLAAKHGLAAARGATANRGSAASTGMAGRPEIGREARSGPWSIESDAGGGTVTVTHRATGEQVRYAVKSADDPSDSAAPDASDSTEVLVDSRGRTIAVDLEAPWP